MRKLFRIGWHHPQHPTLDFYKYVLCFKKKQAKKYCKKLFKQSFAYKTYKNTFLSRKNFWHITCTEIQVTQIK